MNDLLLAILIILVILMVAVLFLIPASNGSYNLLVIICAILFMLSVSLATYLLYIEMLFIAISIKKEKTNNEKITIKQG